MPTFSLTDATLPVFTHCLTTLGAILTKAEADATARGIDPSVFLTARLAPDMFPLTRQVQIMTDIAKSCAARLAEQDVPSYPDTETSFADLQARLTKTRTFIEGISAKNLAPDLSRDITLTFGPKSMTFTLTDYCLGFALPNVYFHLTTTYDILRHNGVPLGKQDFIGNIPLKAAA